MATRRSYRSSSVGCALALVALAAGCEGERVLERTIVLRLPDATSCAPASALASLRLRVLGDGPGDPASVLSLSPDAPVRALPDLPYPTRVVLAVAEAPGWRGLGWRAVGSAGDEITLLPPGLSCPVADPDARAPEGAAIAVLADGTLVIAGGLDGDGRATGRLALLAPGGQVTEATPGRLALASAFGSATALDDGRLLVVGGAISAGAPAYDQLEIVDPRVDGARVIEPLAGPRRDHAALRLRDGRVVLVGGRAAGDGAPVRAIEMIDPARVETTVLGARLGVARVAPWLGLGEDGRVWVAGGALDDDDARVIERLDVARDAIERFEVSGLPPPIALATLPGDRLAWIGAREVHVVALHVVPPAASRALDPPALDAARAVGTAGRALVVGTAGAARAAYTLDPGAGTVGSRAASRAPSALVDMVDGSVVELAGTGASLRREEAPTPFDEPPATLLFAADDAWWVADPIGAERWSAPRFEVQGGALVAREAGARIDVRALRGSRWALALDARGAIEVRVVGARGAVTVEVGDAELAVGDCRAPRAGDAAIDVAPGRITLGAQGCAIDALGEVGLAFVAREAGAELVRLRLTRR